MAEIGIFWVYRNRVIGKSLALNEGVENLSGLIDSPDSHFQLWEHDNNFVIPFPELESVEYQKIPRGRVLFDRVNQKPIIYMDRSLFNEETKLLIREFFDLDAEKRLW